MLIDLFQSAHRALAFLAGSSLALAVLVVAGAVVAAALASWTRSGSEPADTILAPPSSARFRLGETDFEHDGAFHHATVIDRGRIRSLCFKHEERPSSMSLDDRYEGAAEHAGSFHIGMVLGAGIRRVLFIGLGGGSVPERFVRDYPEVTVGALELDPLAIEVARDFFHLETGPRLRVASLDGRAFVERSTERWDLIGIDADTTNAYGSTMPPHSTAREPFVEVAIRLALEELW